ncbi:andropin [Drosophila santomea]|uniref:andropin n=1 Tax=Drosophila santomea TaxID=129105 RepID=UPI00195321BE|nr:andropin [Drosophila santomea]
MKYFSILVVLGLILAISVGQSDAIFVDVLDNVESALHNAAKAGFKLIRPIEKMILPR